MRITETAANCCASKYPAQAIKKLDLLSVNPLPARKEKRIIGSNGFWGYLQRWCDHQ
jgi:hypothetical protein